MKFREKIYAKLKKIPRGKVTTYKALANSINSKAYRAIGTAMNKNPYAPKVPCHRCINSNGRVGGFASGTKKKIAILKKEGVEVINGNVDLKKFEFKFR
ncbi:MAG: MGMT family protein [archaeon]